MNKVKKNFQLAQAGRTHPDHFSNGLVFVRLGGSR